MGAALVLRGSVGGVGVIRPCAGHHRALLASPLEHRPGGCRAMTPHMSGRLTPTPPTEPEPPRTAWGWRKKKGGAQRAPPFFLSPPPPVFVGAGGGGEGGRAGGAAPAPPPPPPLPVAHPWQPQPTTIKTPTPPTTAKRTHGTASATGRRPAAAPGARTNPPPA